MIIHIENIKTFNDVGYYVGRSTPLGNHFPLSMGRMECIEAYKIWLIAELRSNRYNNVTRYFNFLRNEIYVRGDIHLICHCAPLPCHAQVIAELLLKGEL
jgi:hypothetical protein